MEKKIVLDNDKETEASVPAGESIGKYEAIELRDGDPQRYDGVGVLKAVANVNQIIAPQLIGQDPIQQKKLDDFIIKLDGSKNKEKLGANAILSVSQAICEAGALATGLPLYQYINNIFLKGQPSKSLLMPVPTFNLINGGKHGAGNLAFQEFHVVPASGRAYYPSLEMVEEIYHEVEDVLIRHGAIHSVGDEGGFAPNLFTNMDALEVIIEAIKESGNEFRKDVFLGLDVAASHFYKDGKYLIRDRTQPVDAQELNQFYQDLVKSYPLLILEDPLYKDDWSGWINLTSQFK